jgi:predicted RNA-binding protein YlqC (UPF0109 family)
MKALIEYIARSLVDGPTECVCGPARLLARSNWLEVAAEDMGRVIGRSGRVAAAMRTLLRVAAVKQGVRATLDIR